MADKKDLDFTYSTLDQIFRLSLGETGDFSGARYEGNFSLTLEEAQENKYRFLVDNLHICDGSKVLDMGCGWGPFLNYLKKEKNLDGMGLTLSGRQAKACQKNGLQVLVKDCRNVKKEDYGPFDAIASLGAFEHFCSLEEYLAGKQEEVYGNYFKSVYNLLPPGGRFYLQTMVFGKNMIKHDQISIDADKNSDAYILALMVKQFPGSWLPYGHEMVTKTAAPYFKLKSLSSGRLDYIETIKQWRKKFRKFNVSKYLLYLKLLPKYFTDKEFRHKIAIFRISPNKVCFEREIMEHYRFVFEKV